MSHTDLTDPTDFNSVMIPRTSKITKVTKINLTDDKFIFYLNHSENVFSRCFRENINLCSQKQSSLGKRLSSERFYRFFIRSIRVIRC